MRSLTVSGMRSLGVGACKIGVKSFRHHGAHVASLVESGIFRFSRCILLNCNMRDKPGFVYRFVVCSIHYCNLNVINSVFS